MCAASGGRVDMDPALPINAPPMPGCPAQFSFGCQCSLQCPVWAKPEMRAAIYPRSRLLVCQGLLLRYEPHANFLFGRHKLENLVEWVITPSQRIGAISPLLFSRSSVYRGVNMMSSVYVDGVGLSPIQALQRWWRRVRQLRREKVLAFMMASHPRLGSESQLKALDEDLLRLLVRASSF